MRSLLLPIGLFFYNNLHNYIFKSPSTQQIPVIKIIMDSIILIIKDGWIDGHKDKGGQTDREKGRQSKSLDYIPIDSGPALVLLVHS